jgi:hypothetical protein
VLHWPVLLLYPEVMSSDFIEDFPETDLFSQHLDVISLDYMMLFLILCTQMHGNINSSLGLLESLMPLTIKHVLRKFSTFAMGREPCLHKGGY